MLCLAFVAGKAWIISQLKPKALVPGKTGHKYYSVVGSIINWKDLPDT